MEAAVILGQRNRANWYAQKPERYFTGARADFVARLPCDAHAAVLEVGCGFGATGALALQQGRAGRYCGIELSPAAGAVARGRLSEVVIADIEHLALPWPAESFDALILSEVLEHLANPWNVLARLAALVKHGGIVLASSPNVAHWRVIAKLLAGRFPLADSGVFDRTHLRWFTPASFREMFEGAGFEVASVAPVTPYSARTGLVSRLTRRKLDHLLMMQICLEGRRP